MHEEGVIRGRELEYTLAELRVAKGYNQTWYATAPTEIEFYVMKFIRYLPANQRKAERQMRTLSGLSDKNIMIIYETFLYEQQGMKYLVIVTEFYRRGSLLRRIRSRQWDYDNKVRCLFHAACGLQYLHNKNIMHRNIKPENIFRWDKIAKLGDLGVAKELDGSHMTSGLAGYIHMAPQVYDRDQYGLQADIWSLGIVFIEVVLSRELNHIHNWRDSPSQEMDILEQQLHRLPGTIAKLVGGMLQIDREKRVKIDHVVQVMAKVVGLDLAKYRELPLEHFKKKQRPVKKKKEEPIINSKQDLIKYYNNGQPIFPDMPEDFDKNKLIPKFQDIVLPEITDEEIQREIEQAKKNPKPKPDLSKNPMGRMGLMGMGGMGGMRDMMGMMGMNRLMGMGGGMGGLGDMMGSLGGMSDMMAGMAGMGGMGGMEGLGSMGGGRATGESRSSNMTYDFAADLMKNLNNANKKEPTSLGPIKKEEPKPMPSPKVEQKPKTTTITFKAPSQSQKITKPEVAPQVPQPPISPQKVFKKKNVVYPEDGKQTKIKVNPNAKPNNQQSERVKIIDNEDEEGRTPQEAQKKAKAKKKKEDTSKNGTDSQPQAKNAEIKPKKKKKASQTSDLQQKKQQKQQKKPEIQKQIQIKPQKPKTKKKTDSSYQSGAQSQSDQPKPKSEKQPAQVTLNKQQKKKKKKFQSSTDEQAMLNEDIKPTKKKEESKDRKDESSGQNGESRVKKQKHKIETLPPGPKIETPEHVPQAFIVPQNDSPPIDLQKKPDFRQKQVENNLPASYMGSEKSTSDKQSEKGKKKPKKKFGVKQPQPVVQAPKQDFQKLAKIHEQAVQHSYKQAQRKFGINFAKKEEEMRQNQGNSQREREERERVEGEHRRREMQKLRMQKRMERRKERQQLGLPPLDEQMEEYMQQKQFGKLKRDYGTRAHPYQPQQTSMRGMQEEEMEMGMPMNRHPSSGLQMARAPPPGGMPRQPGQSQGPPPAPRPQYTIDQLVEQIYILESGDSSCQQIAVKYIQLGRLYAQTHLYKKAIQVLASALRNLQAIDQVVSERVAEIHFQLGNAYLNTQSPETALQSLTMARQTRASLGIPESDIDIAILNSMGVAFRQLGHTEQAKNCYQEAIKKAHQARRNPFSLVNPLSNLAGIIQAEGNTEQALKVLKDAQKLLKQAQCTGEGPYSSISQSIIELLFAMKNNREGLQEINLLFRLYIDNRRTVQAEYYRFRERALKHIISTMSKSKNRQELTLIEGLLTEYYQDQTKVAEKLREMLFGEGGQGVIDEMEGLD